MSVRKAILNATLIDGTGGRPLRDAVIAIEGTRIDDVGTARQVDVPLDGELIDAAGSTVIPGLFDCHMHLGGGPYKAIKTLRDTLNMGITTVAHVGGFERGADVVALRDAIDGGLVGPCSRLVAGAVVAATAGHVRGRVADGPWEVRRAVREQRQANVDFIKTAASGGFWAEHEECWWRDYTFEELEALVDEAHAVGKRVAVHAHTQPGLNNAIRAEADMIHHGAFIDDEALRGMAEGDLFFVPTLRVTSERNIAIKERAGCPWEARKMAEAHDIHREGVRKARRMGIRIAVGTDLPGTPPWQAGDTAVELTELVACGLSPMEALVAATRTSAEALGVESDLGTIEPGKVADLVIVAEDPLTSLEALTVESNLVVVMKAGEVVVRREQPW
ncbi:MAG: amidohydrolase family protein [Armatimonadota bacterium]